MASLILYLPGLDLSASRVTWLTRGSVKPCTIPYWQLVHTWLYATPPAHGVAPAQAMAFADGVWTQGEWLIAEPLHLTVDLAHIYHLHPETLVLDASERDALFATLQAHLAEYHLALRTSPAGRWYLHSRDPLEINTVAPSTFLGQSIRAYLPTGPRQTFWQRLMTEIQMLLASHPVNAQRRQRGAPTLDTLWLWGEGAPLPDKTVNACSSLNTVCSDDPAVVGLAQALGIHAVLTHWDACQIALNQHQLPTTDTLWCFTQTKITAETWLATLRDALRQRQLAALSLYPKEPQHIYLQPQDLAPWKFWKLFSFS